MVIFNILTIHGSHVNTTNEMRRLVRVGYRHPGNVQTKGQSAGRPNLMVYGKRERAEGELLFITECHGTADIRRNGDAEFGIQLEAIGSR